MRFAGPPLTLADQVGNLLGHGLKTKPDDLALASAKTQISWRELDELRTRLVAQYLTLGLVASRAFTIDKTPTPSLS